ncbi:MAG: carbohydrate ABC transporter permease [Clostridia bacterium]|nr:carbohydrate ABC transporter permease [Clostridia bacterium]
MKSKSRFSWKTLGTIAFAALSLAYVAPLLLVLMNSFKDKSAISTTQAFDFPNGDTFVGIDNYIYGVEQAEFFKYFGYTAIITVGSVLAILLCTSMCAWYISRVNSRVTRMLFLAFVFSMVVPFQMVMFTLSKTADVLGLNTPWGIIVIYLGFGAGLATFMFSGFVKSIPIEIEEAAMIDGCSPLQTFFRIVMPIMKPTYVSVGILEAMWIWNDFLLPYLVLDLKKYKTVSIVMQNLSGSYGRVEMGALMACIVLSIVPIIVFYVSCQKYIIKGVVDGAVKG